MFMFLPWHAFVKCQVQPEGLAVDVNGPPVPRLWEQPWRRQLRIVALQYVMWLTTYYCYTQALAIIPVSLATSLFAASPSFVYLLSLCLLKERPGLWPALAALTSAGGITLISQPWTAAGGASALGSVLAVCGGASVALYNVSLRKHLGKALPAETAYYMGCLGALNIAVGWVIPLALAGLGAEPRVAARAIPWAPLLASGALGLVSNILTNVGVAVTHPLVVAMGVVVGIPVNLLIDVAWRGEHLDTLQIAGVITMMAAFCLMLAKDALPSCTLCPCGVQPPRTPLRSPLLHEQGDKPRCGGDGGRVNPQRHDKIKNTLTSSPRH